MSGVYLPARVIPDFYLPFFFQGRFFAATELKAMLAHMVINYDLKAEVEGVRPPDDIFGLAFAPNARAKVWFRKRSVL
jgi:hypothetical protein